MPARYRLEKRWQRPKIIEGGQGRLSTPLKPSLSQHTRRRRLPFRCLETSTQIVSVPIFTLKHSLFRTILVLAKPIPPPSPTPLLTPSFIRKNVPWPNFPFPFFALLLIPFSSLSSALFSLLFVVTRDAGIHADTLKSTHPLENFGMCLAFFVCILNCLLEVYQLATTTLLHCFTTSALGY